MQPRIINEICEFCGIKADVCPHYAGKSKPMDEKERLALSEGAPAMPKIHIEPLKPEEKAASVAEAKAKMAAMVAEAENTQLVEPENTEL